MRGVQWSPTAGLRCQDCGGYEIDLRSDGTARCRTCGRVSKPHGPFRFAGIGHLAFALAGIVLLVFGAEALISLAYARGDQILFLHTISVMAFFTGVAAVAVAGIGAAPGRVALGPQRMDRFSRMYPVQDPVMTGSLNAAAEARPAEEPGSMGLLMLAGVGFALMALGYFAGI